MKTPCRVILLLVLISVTLPSWGFAEDVEIRDFTQSGFTYGYEDWQDLTAVQSSGDKGVVLQGSAKGGVGVIFNDLLDLSDSGQVEVTIRQGPGNTASKLLLKLIPADEGAPVTGDINFSDVSDTDFTKVLIDLPVKGAPERESLEVIKQMQIQGTFNPAEKVDVEIESIRGVGHALPAK